MTLTQISTAGVKDDAVTSGKIPANAVGSSELADNAVDTAAIANNAVNSDKIATNAVNTTEIADTAVTLAKLEHGTSSNDGKFLRANNGADPTFETVTGTTINNNSDARIITGTNTANTLDAEADLYFYKSGDISVLEINGGASSISTSGEVSSRLNFRCNDGSVAINNSSRVGASIETQDEAGNGAFQALVFKTYQQTLSPNPTLREVARFRYTGDLKFIGGAGIDFGSVTTSGAGSASAILDDYEEGTWTPEMKFNNANSGMTHSQQEGRYTKIGNMVHASFVIGITNKGSSSGNWEIRGLPFTSKNDAGDRINGMVTYYGGMVNVSTHITLYNSTPTNYFFGYNGDGSSTSAQNITNSHVANNAHLRGHVWYRAA